MSKPVAASFDQPGLENHRDPLQTDVTLAQIGAAKAIGRRVFASFKAIRYAARTGDRPRLRREMLWPVSLASSVVEVQPWPKTIC